ncbi:MAG: hypothetical protein ACLR6B_13760 [Blautia sp.]
MKGHKYWYNSRGKMVKDAIIKLNGKFYCFDERGRLMTSRFIRKGTKVYFANSKGQFLTGWRKSIRSSFISVSAVVRCRGSDHQEKEILLFLSGRDAYRLADR